MGKATRKKTRKQADPTSTDLGKGIGRPAHLLAIGSVRPTTIELVFADRSFVLTVERLGMPADRIQWTSAAATPNGDAMTVRGANNELITIDSGTLRYLVDEHFAARIDAALAASQFTPKELRQLARDNPPPPEWYAESVEDSRLESWK